MQTVLQPFKQIQWPSAYFEASSSREPFEDVHIITAKGEFAAKALELSAVSPAKSFSESEIRKRAQQLIASQQITVTEFVSINETGITVCINADTVEDDNVMWRALDMLANALDQLDGTQGIITFGEPLKFTMSDVPWIITQ